MEGWIMAAQLITGLSLLVFVHELGHFIAARIFGIRVDKFFIFFDAWNKKIFSKKIGDTEYGIGWLPLGGYVKISGMIDESMDKEQMKLPPQPYEFRSKPAWQRFIVMVAGVTMNVILGVLIYSFVLLLLDKAYVPIEEINKKGIYAYELAREIGFQTGDKIIAVDGRKLVRQYDVLSMKTFFAKRITVERDGKEVNVPLPKNLFQRIAKEGKNNFIDFTNYPFTVDSVTQNTPADSAGLKAKDRIIAINETVIAVYGSFTETIQRNKNKEIRLSVLRNEDTVLLNAKVKADGTLGFSTKIPKYELTDYTLASAFRYGFKDGFENLIYGTIVPFGKIFKGELNAGDSLQGPIGIAKFYGSVWDWKRFWYLTGLISMVLAFMNLLPIPALDGGHIVFIFIEMIRGKQMSEKVMEKAQVVGMVILFALMAFAIGNDLLKLF